MAADSIIKLASNESPDGPFPGVREAIDAEFTVANRYPDDEAWGLSEKLCSQYGMGHESLLLGNGSVALISDLARIVGGSNTNIVYAWPSFIMYRLAAVWAGSEPREIELDDKMRLDLGAMAVAVDENTSAVFVCNPNNPTGTMVPSAEVEDFVRSLPSSVLAVVDEAYFEYVDEPGHHSLIPLTKEMPNLVVMRTFSKIYALASLRIGYAFGHPDTITEIRKGVAPFTVNRFAQVAAEVSLGQPEELSRRQQANLAGRRYLESALAERGLFPLESQTNFVFFEGPGPAHQFAEQLTARGVIVRPISGPWLRVTVGSEVENRRFVDALDEVLAASD